jgi:hypothetical protein
VASLPQSDYYKPRGITLAVLKQITLTIDEDIAEDEAGRGGFKGNLVRKLSTGAIREILASTLLLIGSAGTKCGDKSKLGL